MLNILFYSHNGSSKIIISTTDATETTGLRCHTPNISFARKDPYLCYLR